MTDELARWAAATQEERAWLCPVIRGGPIWSIMPRLEPAAFSGETRNGRPIMDKALLDSLPAVLCYLTDLQFTGNWGTYMSESVVLDYNTPGVLEFNPEDPRCGGPRDCHE
ncbi:MAG: hypothetical protein HOC74_06935 [Gemmatimonadetes bacterium]|nr:hypothetical protein [Gemmatimonadota bacterium]